MKTTKIRAGIVSAAAMAKHGRWDPAYFLPPDDADVKAAQRNLEAAKTRLANAEKAFAAAEARYAQLVADGDVVPIN